MGFQSPCEWDLFSLGGTWQINGMLSNAEPHGPSTTHLLSTFQKYHSAHFRKCGNSTVKTVRNLRPNSSRPPTLSIHTWTRLTRLWHLIEQKSLSEQSNYRTVPRTSELGALALWSHIPQVLITESTSQRSLSEQEHGRYLAFGWFTGIIGTQLRGRSAKTVWEDKMPLGRSPRKAHDQKDDLGRAQSGSATESP